MTEASDRLAALLGRIPAKNVQQATAPKPSTERPNITPDMVEVIVEQHFTIGKWHGLDNHICPCGGAFLDAEAAAEHWIAHHSGWTAPADTDIVDTGLVDANETPIYKEVEIEPGQTKETEE
jgi:hypothetical protein